MQMQKMTDIQISSQGQMDKPKSAISDKAVDMIDMIHKVFESVYGVMPLDEAGKMAWVSTLGTCKQKGLELANAQWIKTESKAPRPADLLRTYNDLKSEQQKQVKNQSTREHIAGEIVYKCPYCHDTGLMFIDKADKYQTATNCLCRRSEPEIDLNTIKSNGWEFDYHGMIWQRKVWMGDVAND
jgi:hypothetical protein